MNLFILKMSFSCCHWYCKSIFEQGSEPLPSLTLNCRLSKKGVSAIISLKNSSVSPSFSRLAFWWTFFRPPQNRSVSLPSRVRPSQWKHIENRLEPSQMNEQRISFSNRSTGSLNIDKQAITLSLFLRGWWLLSRLSHWLTRASDQNNVTPINSSVNAAGFEGVSKNRVKPMLSKVHERVIRWSSCSAASCTELFWPDLFS